MRGECPDLVELARLLRGWLEGTLASLPLDDLKASWEQHRARVEGEHGLFQVIKEGAPRLSGDVESLRREHTTIDREIAHLFSFDDPENHREWVGHLTETIERHCAHSIRVVYDAFDQDIGGGG